ncbi:hypothetical protein ACFVAV_20825 [Nocardia sp. NPDC057663]|uniref:hypothetical protein n=1 Tax=Nocardia sp. NPDC057663 TaxID=3346201 RepID=UPI00366F990F
MIEDGIRLELEGVAVGYLRMDVSGDARQRDQAAIRHLAYRWGYFVAWILLVDETASDPMTALVTAVGRYRADAVFAPSAKHFDGCKIPDSIVTACDVVTVDDRRTTSRRLPSPFA